MQLNGVNFNSNNKPAFGLNINGKIASEISSEISQRNLWARVAQPYARHFEDLKATGMDSSELYLCKSIGGKQDFVLKNPEITPEYEIVLEDVKPGHLLEAWFSITAEKIAQAENQLKSLISEKINGLYKVAFERDDVYQTIMTEGKGKSLKESMENLEHSKIIDLYFNTRPKKS